MNSNSVVLVSGGAGFIGSHLVDRLVERGCTVRVLDNLSTGKLDNIAGHVKSGRVDFVEGDIRDSDTIEKCFHGVDVVFHLAAVTSVPFSVANPEVTEDVNLGGTVNLLAKASDAKVGRFVFASSCAVYGDPERLPVSEDDRVSPISPYAESKLTGEKFCFGLENHQLLKAVALRFFNVYGPRQGLSEYSGVITLFFDRCRQGLPLLVYGDGSQTRDFVYVDDVVSALLKASECDGAEGCVFNVGSGKATTIRDLAETVLKVNGSSSEIIFGKPRAGDIKHSSANISLARKVLGYKPKWLLEDGLRTLAREFLRKENS